MGGRYTRGPFDPFESRPFEGFQQIHIPRPPRRFWIGLGFVVAALLVIFLTAPIGGFITENQWYDALGLGSVYRTRVGLQALLFFGALVLAFAFAAVNAIAALRLRSGGALRAVGIRRRFIRTGAGAAALGGSALIALVMAASARGDWQHLVLWQHYTPTGVTEPVYGMDVSFYLLTLPFLHDLDGWFFGLLFLTGLMVGLLYVWRGETLDLRLTAPALGHLSALLGIFGLAIAGGTLLDRFDLVFSHHGVVYGAGYTDVHVRTGLALAQAIFALLLSGLLIANAFLRQQRLVIGAAAAWIVASIFTGVYPSLVQRVSVQPAELSQESPYIKREIQFTRQSYGVDKVGVRSFGGDQPVTPQALAADQATINNLRLWDNGPIQQTYQQLQSIRTYYSFNQIDLDRYNVNGSTVQVEISAREVDQSKLPSQAQGWVNQKLEYTHGYGVAASPVSAVVGDGLPDYIVGNIPPSGPLKVTNPRIYFGQLTNDYVLAPSASQEFDYPSGADNARNSYEGGHGVSMSGTNRWLWAFRTGDFNLLVSSQVQDRTQMLYRRNVQDRIQAIAPFLQQYDKPYMVVVNGKQYWITDAYVTADTYPYSNAENLPDGTHNYLRNSVKVVTDAYDGTMRFYISDSTDPVIRAYAATFPDLFKPLSSMPLGLRQHIRVPPTQFYWQSTVYATYHISDPATLYNREDVWNLALTPYYVEMRLPGESQAEYLQIIPFSPLNKQNLVGWLAVRNDPGHYGEMVAFVLPKDKVVLGPQQITSRIQQTPTYSRDRTLLNSNGSSLIEGNLLVVPVGNSFLYFQPLYLQASSTQGLPQLKAVLMTDATGQTVVAYQPTLQLALNQLIGEAPPTQITSGTTTTPSQSTQQPTTAVSPQVANLITQANQQYAAAQAALKQGDLATYANDMQQVGNLLQQAAALTGASSTASPSPSAKPSG
jgi:uncharacterized membrane protein (UPF0182 family)